MAAVFGGQTPCGADVAAQRERERLRERERGREQSRAKLGVGLHASTPSASAAALPLPVAVSCLLALPPPIVAMLPVEVGVVEPPRAPTPLPPSWSWLPAYSGDVVAHLLRSTLARLPFLGPHCCSPPAPGWRLRAGHHGRQEREVVAPATATQELRGEHEDARRMVAA